MKSNPVTLGTVAHTHTNNYLKIFENDKINIKDE